MGWTSLSRTVPPAELAVPFDLFKADRRYETNADDTVLLHKLRSAIDEVEGPNGIGLVLITQTWRMSFDCLHGCLTIPLGPVQSITGITYLDDAGAEQTIDPALYAYDLDSSPVRLLPKPGLAWPSVKYRPGAVKVTFVAGFGDTSDDVPFDIQAAILLIAGHRDANREAVVTGTIATQMPVGAQAILNRYAVGRFS